MLFNNIDIEKYIDMKTRATPRSLIYYSTSCERGVAKQYVASEILLGYIYGEEWERSHFSQNIFPIVYFFYNLAQTRIFVPGIHFCKEIRGSLGQFLRKMAKTDFLQPLYGDKKVALRWNVSCPTVFYSGTWILVYTFFDKFGAALVSGFLNFSFKHFLHVFKKGPKIALFQLFL